MTQVAEWLRNIIAAIILAGFLEMLLPSNELKSVTRMTMGLVILMILLQPVLQFLDLPQHISLSLPSISNSDSPQTQQIIAQGLKMRTEWTRGIQEQNKIMLESKLKNIMGLIDEVQVESVKLDYQGEQLNKAIVQLKSARQGIQDISSIKRKIVDSVQLLTDLREDRIEVKWNGR
ncbi:MAG TPA: stage III sporulation protein AF [Firmicutes bacterium]|jgi:stage III sporulation protein AF|nr:stage III sporulation protein AF [Bacillota bacterium]